MLLRACRADLCHSKSFSFDARGCYRDDVHFSFSFTIEGEGSPL